MNFVDSVHSDIKLGGIPDAVSDYFVIHSHHTFGMLEIRFLRLTDIIISVR